VPSFELHEVAFPIFRAAQALNILSKNEDSLAEISRKHSLEGVCQNYDFQHCYSLVKKQLSVVILLKGADIFYS